MRTNLHIKRISLGLFLLSLTLSIFATSTPVAGDGKWYYVKSQRYNTGGPWWTFGADKVVPGALTKSDAQKFTLVTSVEGKVTVKEFGGKKLNASTPTVANFDTNGAATGWTLTEQIQANGIKGYSFPGENSGLHQGSGGWGWQMGAGWYSLTDNCTYFFYEALPDVDLNIAIDDAIVKMNSVVVGTAIGQTPQSAVDNFQSAINTAKTTLGSTDATAIQTAITNLNTATTTFLAAKVPVVDASTAASPIWYLIKNTVRGGKGATLYFNGFNAQLKCTTAANSVAADGTSTGAAAPSLNNLFRFDLQTGGVYRIICAAQPTGEVLQGASGGNSSAVIKYGTPATPVTTWDVKLIGNNATLGVTEIKFVSTNNSVWHDDGSNNLVSWDGGTGGASAWYVEKYTGNVSTLYQVQYDAMVTQYGAYVDGSGNPVAPYTLGTEPGQYDAAKFQALKDAFTAMETEKNTNGITSANMIQKFSDLGTAISTFTASKVAPAAWGGVVDANKTYTLKLVQAGSANDGFYLSNPRTDAGNGTDNSRPQATFSQTIDPTTCLWKFVASATAGKYLICSPRRSTQYEYIDEIGRVRDLAGFGDNIWFYKTLLQNTTNYVAGTTLLVVKIDQSGAYLSCGTGAGATLGNSANWATFKLEEYFPTENVSAKATSVSAYCVNGVINVVGTTEFSVYTVSGQKVRNKGLKQGIYLVKTASQTLKVTVK